MKSNKEIWRCIPNYEGYYLVSNYGRVMTTGKKRNTPNSKSYKRKIIKGGKNKLGYHSITLRDANGNDKAWFVHRLVAITFLPNPNNLTDVNHKDENKSNNCLDNLEWISHKDNCNYGTIKTRIRDAGIKTRENKSKFIDIKSGLVFETIEDVNKHYGLNLMIYHDYLNINL